MSPAASIRNRLLVGTAALFAGRLILSLVRSGPVLVADEIGYLTNARVLSGGLPGQLDQAPFYHGGFSLLLWPFLKLSSDPELVYHLVLVLNAALVASLFPLLYALLTRHTGIAPDIAIWAAFAGAAYPALTVLSQVSMSENALFPLVCIWLICVGGLMAASEPRIGLLCGLGTAASAVALWAVHGRMVTVLALTVLIVGWLGLRRRLHPASIAAVLVVLAAGIWAADQLNDYLIDQSYGGEVANEASDRISSVFNGHGPLTAVANLVGQSWYLLVSTFGLAAVVFARALVPDRRLASEAVGERLPAVIPVLVALTVLLLCVSAGSFPDRFRPDMLVYGRYVEVVTPALVAVGLSILAARRSAALLSRPIVALVLLSFAVVMISVSANDPGNPNRWNISGLPFVTGGLGPPILIGAGLVAAGGAWLLGRLAPRRPVVLGAAAIALFLPTIFYGIWNPVLRSQRNVNPSGWTSPEPVAKANNIRSLGYDMSHYDVIGLYAYQWFLPHTSVRPFNAARRPAPSRYIISGSGWPGEHPGTGAVDLWVAKGRDQVLWRLARTGEPTEARGRVTARDAPRQDRS